MKRSLGRMGLAVYVLAAMSCVLLAGSALAADGALLAAKLPGGIVIDGDLGDWAGFGVPAVMDREEQVCYENQYWSGVSDLSGKVWFGWDYSGLYLAARVNDDDLTPDSATSWQSDALNLFIDARNNTTPERAADMVPYQGIVDPDDYLFKFVALGPDSKADVCEFLQNKGRPENVEVAAKKTATGYVLEALMPWETLGLEGAPDAGYKLGVNVSLEDANEQGYMIWNGTSEGWAKVTDYGTLTLGRVPQVVSIPFAKSSPVLDGLPDDVWKSGEPIDVSGLTTVLLGKVDGNKDLSAKVYSLWDKENFYIFMDIVDDVITVTSPKGEEWKDDGNQIFIDYPWAGGAYGAGTLRIGLTPTDTAGDFTPVVYDWSNPLAVAPGDIKAASGKTENGYTLELAIPWSIFKGFEPPIAGQVMGFDFALNDHDRGEEADQAPIGAAVYLWAGDPSVGGDANQFGDMILLAD